MRVICCPDCGGIESENAMYIPAHCPFCMSAKVQEARAVLLDDEQLKTLWQIFGDIPMNPETEEIEDSFLYFPAGTHREEIWHWFDERYTGGVHALIFGFD